MSARSRSKTFIVQRSSCGVEGGPVMERGLSMVEVLVALTIVAFGMLGLLGLQAWALSVQKDAFHRRHAAELVAQLAERMRANHLGFLAGRYAVSFEASSEPPAAAPACIAPCTSAQVAERDLDQWRIELRRRIPGAAAYLQWNAESRSGIAVAVAWPEPHAAGNDGVCDTLMAGGAVLPASYRCYRTRVFP
jgi:type IV pilus assembly protein PilV